MQKVSTFLILILFTGCASRGGAPGIPAPPATVDPMEDMADEFKRLRAIEGHFDGGAWNDDVDEWMGRKHRLMIELGDRFGAGTTGILSTCARADAACASFSRGA